MYTIDIDMGKLFLYKHDQDENGIVYHVGTNFGTESWQNPYDRKLIKLSSSEWIQGSIGAMVARTPDHSWAKPIEGGPWVIIDFGKDLLIKPNKYTLRDLYYNNHMLSWTLEGGHNIESYNPYLTSNKISNTKPIPPLLYGILGNDYLAIAGFIRSDNGRIYRDILNICYAYYHLLPDWTVIKRHKNDYTMNVNGDTTHSWDINVGNAYFSKFRIKMTEKNSNRNWYYHSTNFEIYGHLLMKKK